MFYKNGWLEPVSTYDFSDYPKASLGLGTFGNKTYLVPLVTEWQVLYYRKDLFKKAGIAVPATFVELEAAAKKLNSADVAGFAARGKGAAAVTPALVLYLQFRRRLSDQGCCFLQQQRSPRSYPLLRQTAW